jgi:hypothetical protein
LHGTKTVALDTEKKEEVQSFINDLSLAIAEDMASIRETELNRSGFYRRGFLFFEDESLNSGPCDIFIDRLGRVITPAGEPWMGLTAVQVDDHPSQVVRKEFRYSGDQQVGIVFYLSGR